MNPAVEALDPLPRLAGSRPLRVCEGLELSVPARAALADDPGPESFLATLQAAGCDEDAILYLAHALPRTDAVAWACACVLALRGDTLPAAALRALQAAQRWAAAPDTQACQAAAAAAEAEGLQDEGAARFGALAAAWSGDSLGPAGLPATPPPAAIGSLAVAAAVALAVAAGEPSALAGRQWECLALGLLQARA
jgi:hypothetical protein